MRNGYHNKNLGGLEVEINDKKYYLTPGIQKVLVNTSYNTAKSMNDKDNLVFRDMFLKTTYLIHKPTKGRISSRDRYIKNNFDKFVLRILNLDTKLDGRGIEKIILPSNIIDIYQTRSLTRMKIIW